MSTEATFSSFQLGHLAEDAPTGLVIRAYKRASDMDRPLRVLKLQYQGPNTQASFCIVGALRVLVGRTCTSSPPRLYRGFTKASLSASTHVRTKRSDLRLQKIHWLCSANLGKEASFSQLRLEAPLYKKSLIGWS